MRGQSKNILYQKQKIKDDGDVLKRKIRRADNKQIEKEILVLKQEDKHVTELSRGLEYLHEDQKLNIKKDLVVGLKEINFYLKELYPDAEEYQDYANQDGKHDFYEIIFRKIHSKYINLEHRDVSARWLQAIEETLKEVEKEQKEVKDSIRKLEESLL